MSYPRTSPNLIRWLSVGLLVSACAAWLWVQLSAPQPAPAATPASTEDVTEPAPESTAATWEQVPAAYQTPRDWPEEPFAPSLEGTQIDGRLAADEDGHLILELAVKDLFDYILNTVGEVSPEEAIDQIAALARDHLPEPAASQAIDLLDQYLDYKRQAVALSHQPLASPDQQTPEYLITMLDQGLGELKAIRRQTFSSEAVAAFFELEESYGDFTVDRLRILHREDLSDLEKQQQIQLLRESLPPVLRQTEERMAREETDHRQIMDVLENATSSDEAETALRALDLPEDRIQTLVTQQERQRQFDTQYSAYRSERQQLEGAALSGADHENALERLRQDHFQDEEFQTLARLRDLDDLEDALTP